MRQSKVVFVCLSYKGAAQLPAVCGQAGPDLQRTHTEEYREQHNPKILFSEKMWRSC